ncbi:MAG: hypothetical protein MI919_02625 [Holophagales bacterium]|nr:hypothetical protein [Holophagales bacterium]
MTQRPRLAHSCSPILIALGLAVLVSSAAVGQESYVDWQTATGSGATFTWDLLTGTVQIPTTVNAGSTANAIELVDGATNYPDAWYSPAAPPVGTEWLSSGVGNLDGANPGTADWVITFSGPVVDPRFHFLNLDAATVDFGATTDTSSNPVALSLLSGNPELEVAGNVVNSTPRQAFAFGCEDAVGGNPEGACGTVQLTGTYDSVTFTLTDTDINIAGGDGFWWTLSATGPVPVELQSFTID